MSEAPEIEPQDRFIAPEQPEDAAERLAETEADPALLEEEPLDPELEAGVAEAEAEREAAGGGPLPA